MALPYITAPGNVQKAIEGIKKAAVPPKVSGDFVKNILGIKGGSGDQVTSYLKKIGLADTSGSPTQLYNRLRNPATAGAAVAEAMRHAYEPLFARNEYIHTVSDEALKGIVVEETGLAHDSSVVKLITSCFKALNELADFEGHSKEAAFDTDLPTEKIERKMTSLSGAEKQQIGLNLGYTINLNLPPTNDVSVFNAIFKSLKENLLSDKDG